LKTPFPRIRRAAEAKRHRRRKKRNLMGLLDSFVSGVSKQMQDLIQESNSTAAFMQSEIVTVQPHTVRSEAAKCRVTVLGKVNCSRVVYENSKQWRRSKLDIDSKIARLKDQLDTLKVI
jgi:Sulfatase protein